jgi:hypothetical protein
MAEQFTATWSAEPLGDRSIGGMIHMPAYRAKQLKGLFDFFELLSRAEDRSYFDLPPRIKQMVREFETPAPDLPHIEAWSFVPHPAVIEEFAGPDGKLERYILTIDTQRSSVYSPVRDFLKSQNANVSSYYSGGWADFLCDVQMDRVRFEEFVNSLRKVLKDADAEKFCPRPRGVDALISIFKVEEPLVVCGQILRDLRRPDPATLRSVLDERVKFEMALRNYRSSETISLFRTQQELQKYLKRLKAKGLIICFRVVTDFSRFSNYDYVPMGTGHRTIGHLIEDSRDEPDLLEPVRELFKVVANQTTDNAEDEVTHIFINQYPLPGKRKDWKRLVYRHSKIDVNLYNYPLEGPINEAPIYLSDLPEFLSRAKAYAGNGGVQLGKSTHSMLKEGPVVWLPLPGLARHGMTLGDPGTGKTNADLLLVSQACQRLQNVVILDDSGGVSSKLEALPADARKKLTRTEITTLKDLKHTSSIIDDCLTTAGVHLLEVPKDIYGSIGTLIFNRISGMPDLIKGNRPREIQKLLIVEEAADLFVNSDTDPRRQLLSLVDQAYRKGWCIWLSLQRPSSLGADAGTLLKNLENKIMYRLNDRSEVQLVADALTEAGMRPRDIEYLTEALPTLPQFTAFAIGVALDKSTETLLAPVPVRITYLQTRNGK